MTERIKCTLIAEISNSRIKAFIYSKGLFLKRINFEPNILIGKIKERATGAFELDKTNYIISSSSSDTKGYTRLVDEDKEVFLKIMICACIAHSLDVININKSYDVLLYLTLLEERSKDDLKTELDKTDLKIEKKNLDIKFELKGITLEGEMGCLLLSEKFPLAQKTYSLDGGYGTTILMETDIAETGDILYGRTIGMRKIYRIGTALLIEYIAESIKKHFIVKNPEDFDHIRSQIFSNNYTVINHKGKTINIEKECRIAITDWFDDKLFKGMLGRIKMIISNGNKIALIGGLWNLSISRETLTELIIKSDMSEKKYEDLKKKDENYKKVVNSIEDFLIEIPDPRMAPSERMLKAVLDIEGLKEATLKDE